jgi:hypothetical protein
MSNPHFFKVVPTGLTGLTKFTGMLIPTGKNKIAYFRLIGSP